MKTNKDQIEKYREEGEKEDREERKISRREGKRENVGRWVMERLTTTPAPRSLGLFARLLFIGLCRPSRGADAR